MAVETPLYSDCKLLFKLESECFDYDQISQRQFSYFLTKAKSIFLVYRQDSEIAAYIMGLFRARSQSVYLYSLAVHPQSRGQGLGTILLNAFEKSVRERGFLMMKAHTKVDNHAMLSLFKKSGWMTGHVVPRFYTDGTDAITLFKRILV
jgi:ribosomal-protein-alanine N-acetyltransferase